MDAQKTYFLNLSGRMDPGELFCQMPIKCGRISANTPHAAKYPNTDLKETSAFIEKSVFSIIHFVFLIH